MRVAGNVPPKIAMPTKPSNRPRRSRDIAGEDMARVVSWFAHTRTVFWARRMAAMQRLLMTEAAPHQADAGQKQKPEHDVTKISVAKRVIGSRAEPGAGERPREGA